MKRAAESQAVELGIILEVSEDGSDQMRYVVVEDQRGKTVTRGGGWFGERGVDRQLQIHAAAECDETGRGVGNKMRLRIEFLDHAVEDGLDRRLHRGERLRRGIAGRTGFNV